MAFPFFNKSYCLVNHPEQSVPTDFVNKARRIRINGHPDKNRLANNVIHWNKTPIARIR